MEAVDGKRLMEEAMEILGLLLLLLASLPSMAESIWLYMVFANPLIEVIWGIYSCRVQN